MSNLPFVAPVVVAVMAAARAAGRKRGAARNAGPKPVSIQHDFGDPELAALRVAVRQGDWDAAAAVLQPCRDRGDHSRLIWMISCVDELGGNFLLDIGRLRPQDPLARTLSGARHIAWAWEARSGLPASRVGEGQFQLFHERLRLAEEHLYAAAESDPESAAPWSSLTTASRGLEHGPDVTRRRFEAGVRRAPTSAVLHAEMLQQLCPKWGGSHEEMHGFARELLAKAPPGSPLGALTAAAHIEHWRGLPQAERAAYMCSPDVVDELCRAADASVLHPDFAPGESPYPALNVFAMAFWLAGDATRARPLFERIGDHPTRSPWTYCGNPGLVFAKARQETRKARRARTLRTPKRPKAEQVVAGSGGRPG
ncbi:hypothetical protein [Streptacidiphilus anmyonensis]|uniref:hypothetical protein n=1 Tax=Streptacidiphilus anmyonensis TaxID=405782 RepID=UPI000693EF24|nr:hypothetical protein [Streptacidiphilus anmyonensis]